MLPTPPLPVVFELSGDGFRVALPLLGLEAQAESQEEAVSLLTEAARRFLADYLASPSFFFDLPGGSAALPYVFAMQEAEAAGSLQEFLTGEAPPDPTAGL